jgi:hypothetical protein
MSKQDIYGSDPDGGAKEAGNEALRIMKGLGITGTEAKSTGKETSRNGLEDLRKGDKT